MNVCFIINPKSGTGDWKGIEQKITKYLSPQFSSTIVHTKRPGHATELAREAAKTNSVIVAVGGDGLVNETARGVIAAVKAQPEGSEQETILGIIPTGSGNALARHLGIPMSQKKAIECLNRKHTELIDTATLNDEPFFAVAGTGFDAEVAARFALSGIRGFWTYCRLAFVRFFTYKPAEYIITTDSKGINRKAFLISVANGSQYGNNAFIAPYASLQSGMLDVCILKPFPLLKGPGLVWRLFTKTLDRSPYMETVKGQNIEIRRTDGNPMPVHYDGETMPPANNLIFEVKPKTLKVILPEGRKI